MENNNRTGGRTKVVTACSYICLLFLHFRRRANLCQIGRLADRYSKQMMYFRCTNTRLDTGQLRSRDPVTEPVHFRTQVKRTAVCQIQQIKQAYCMFIVYITVTYYQIGALYLLSSYALTQRRFGINMPSSMSHHVISGRTVVTAQTYPFSFVIPHQ